MHLISIDEVSIVLSAAEVEVCRAELCLIVIDFCLFTLLHEADEGNNTRSWSNHHYWDSMCSWHYEARVFHEAHAARLNFHVASSLLFLKEVLEVAGDETRALDGTIGEGDIVA